MPTTILFSDVVVIDWAKPPIYIPPPLSATLASIMVDLNDTVAMSLEPCPAM